MARSRERQDFVRLGSIPILVEPVGRVRTYHVNIDGVNHIIKIDDNLGKMFTTAVPHFFKDKYVDLQENPTGVLFDMTDYVYCWKTIKKSQKFGYTSEDDLLRHVYNIISKLCIHENNNYKNEVREANQKNLNDENEDGEQKKKIQLSKCGGTQKILVDDGDTINPSTICRLVPTTSSTCAEAIDRFLRLYSATLTDMVNFEFHRVPFFSYRVVQFMLACCWIRDITINVPRNCTRIYSHHEFAKPDFFINKSADAKSTLKSNGDSIRKYRKDLKKKQRAFEQSNKSNDNVPQARKIRNGEDITEENEALKELVSRLQKRRDELRKKQANVAREIGCDKNQLSRFETSDLTYDSALTLAVFVYDWIKNS